MRQTHWYDSHTRLHWPNHWVGCGSRAKDIPRATVDKIIVKNKTKLDFQMWTKPEQAHSHLMHYLSKKCPSTALAEIVWGREVWSITSQWARFSPIMLPSTKESMQVAEQACQKNLWPNQMRADRRGQFRGAHPVSLTNKIWTQNGLNLDHSKPLA